MTVTVRGDPWLAQPEVTAEWDLNELLQSYITPFYEGINLCFTKWWYSKLAVQLNEVLIDDTGRRRPPKGGGEKKENLEVLITESFGPSPSAEVD